jgi:hypothetical protein
MNFSQVSQVVGPSVGVPIWLPGQDMVGYAAATERYRQAVTAYLDRWLHVYSNLSPRQVIEVLGYDWEQRVTDVYRNPLNQVKPQVGLNDYVFTNTTNPYTGAKLTRGHSQEHWAPAWVIDWEVSQKMLVLYRQKLAQVRREDAREAEQRQALHKRKLRKWYVIAVILTVLFIIVSFFLVLDGAGGAPIVDGVVQAAKVFPVALR